MVSSSVSVLVLSQYSKYSDKDIIKLYRKTRDSIYISVMLCRYEPLLLKIISQWHTRHMSSIYLERSDLDDVREYAYLGMIVCFDRVRDVDSIKNVGSRIKSYVYYILDKHYRYRRYEMTVDVPLASGSVSSLPRTKVPMSLFHYLKYYYKYNYYKLAMLYTGSITRKSMRNKIYKMSCKLLNELKNKLMLV